MKIDNAQQMLQHIDAGGALAVGNDGALKTQNAAAQFFQRVGDAFRQLSASGRASIAERNEHLQDAMAALVRRDNALPNLAGPAVGDAVDGNVRNALCARMEMARYLSQFPPDARASVCRVTHSLLQNAGTLAGTPEEVRTFTRQCMARLGSSPAMVRVLANASAGPTEDGLRAMQDGLGRNLGQEFLKPSQQAFIRDGFHESFEKDAIRGSISLINGAPPREGQWKAQLAELVPDDAMRGFISMMASQAGMEGSLWGMLLTPDGARPNGIPSVAEMIPDRVKDTVVLHKYDISTEEGRLDLHLFYDVQYSLLEGPGGTIPQGEVPLGTHRYEATLSMPLDQDMTGRQVPDFTISQFTMVPSEA